MREEESRTRMVGGGNGESGGDGETPFEREYKDYATGYASVPGLAYENMGWVTEVEGVVKGETVPTGSFTDCGNVGYVPQGVPFLFKASTSVHKCLTCF